MKRQALISSLIAGAALTVLGGCAYDDDYYGRGYGGGYGGGSVYYGGGYYEPDYYYGPTYYGRTYIPRGSYGGGYRYRHDGDRNWSRRDGGGDRGGDRRDYRRGDNGGNRDNHNYLESFEAFFVTVELAERGGEFRDHGRIPLREAVY